MLAHALIPTVSHEPATARSVVRPQWVRPGYPVRSVPVAPPAPPRRDQPAQPRLLWSADEDFDG
jgi:hypothetical protein